MAFSFRYVGLTFSDMGCGHWVGQGHQQWNLLGRLTKGRIELGEAILLPTISGVPFQGYVARFAETLSEWCGLPWHTALSAEGMPDGFCLCAGGSPGDYGIVCPGVARSA